MKLQLLRLALAGLILVCASAGFFGGTAAYSRALDRVAVNCRQVGANVFSAVAASAASLAALLLIRWTFDHAAALDRPDSDEPPFVPVAAIGWVRYVPWLVFVAGMTHAITSWAIRN